MELEHPLEEAIPHVATGNRRSKGLPEALNPNPGAIRTARGLGFWAKTKIPH